MTRSEPRSSRSATAAAREASTSTTCALLTSSACESGLPRRLLLIMAVVAPTRVQPSTSATYMGEFVPTSATTSPGRTPRPLSTWAMRDVSRSRVRQVSRSSPISMASSWPASRAFSCSTSSSDVR